MRAVVLYLGVLAVHRLAAHGAAAERLDQRLVPEADAEHGRAGAGEGADRLDRVAGLGRGAGPRGDDEPIGLAVEQLLDRRAIVAHRLHLGAELAQVLDEVVGEGVVVVDDQGLHLAQGQSGCAQASSTALNIAFALFTDSLYS